MGSKYKTGMTHERKPSIDPIGVDFVQGVSAAYDFFDLKAFNRDDFSDRIGDPADPYGILTPGGVAFGRIEKRFDRDLFQINLTAGETYTFDLGSRRLDTHLRLLDANGVQLALDDDSGNLLNSSITMTIATSGTYFLEAKVIGGTKGFYNIRASGSTTPPPPAGDDFRDSIGDTTTPLGTLSIAGASAGSIETVGDKDFFAISLEVGETYTFDLLTIASPGLSDPMLKLFSTSGNLLASNDDFGGSLNSQITYRATQTGTFFLEASSAVTNDIGRYSLSARSAVSPPGGDDFRDGIGDTTAPFGALTPGSTSTGSIETTGDKDVFAINLEAGKTYTFDLRSGTASGLSDPLLKLFSSTGTLLRENDDFGTSLNSQITFQADRTGTFYLEASSALTNGIGRYSITSTTATSPPLPTGAFDIEIRFTGDAQFQAAFEQAAARWEQVIVGDLPSIVSARLGVIDDLVIEASAIAIDGQGGILAQAGPREFRSSGSGLPFSGIMEFDTADLQQMAAGGRLVGVITHEMGHVLGLGTLWDRFGLKADNFSYTGQNALTEYRRLSGNAAATFVPLENTGGAGTQGSHWRESVFESELMTGFDSGRMELSRLTIAALQDLGYEVNYSAADAYTLPLRAGGEINSVNHELFVI